ncbi:MAG: nucleotidyltransferase domain-containing protein [Bacillota bacterium]
MEPIMAAKALVEERYPECLAAFVGGSVIAGTGTSTSDLDLVIITTREDAPFRESLRYEGWPVELFVHTTESYKWYFASDAQRSTCILARMCLEGVVLRDVNGVAEKVREDARRLIEAGPEPLSKADLDFRRYMLTDLLDDFVGSTRPEETVFIASGLVNSSIELLLAVNRKWQGRNKWAARALDALDPALTREAVLALQEFHVNKSREGLVRFATKALDAAGGRLFEGYCSAGRRSGS